MFRLVLTSLVCGRAFATVCAHGDGTTCTVPVAMDKPGDIEQFALLQVGARTSAQISDSKTGEDPVYHPASAGTATCDFGSPVSSASCQQAVEQLAGKFDKTVDRREVQTGTWNGPPAGCSVGVQPGGAWRAYYKEECNAGEPSCSHGSYSPICNGQDQYHLAPAGTAACDFGSDVSSDLCQQAAEQLAAQRGKTVDRTEVQTGAWNGPPAGCSVGVQPGGAWRAYHKKECNAGEPSCSHGSYSPVCTGQKYHLASAGMAACDFGSDVSSTSCQLAVEQLAHQSGKTVDRKEVQTGTWNGPPAGCSVGVQPGGAWRAYHKAECNAGEPSCSHGRYSPVCTGE